MSYIAPTCRSYIAPYILYCPLHVYLILPPTCLSLILPSTCLSYIAPYMSISYIAPYMSLLYCPLHVSLILPPICLSLMPQKLNIQQMTLSLWTYCHDNTDPTFCHSHLFEWRLEKRCINPLWMGEASPEEGSNRTQLLINLQEVSKVGHPPSQSPQKPVFTTKNTLTKWGEKMDTPSSN